MAIRSFVLSGNKSRPEWSNSTLGLINGLMLQLSPSEPYAEKTAEDFGKMMDGGSVIFCIGEFGGCEDPEALIAIATLCPQRTFSCFSGTVEDVVVDDDYRGEGYGREVMKMLISHACSVGMECLELTSRPTREAANSLYQKLGFEKRDTNPYRLTL